jgi:Uma2 family endonuclease
VPEYWVLDLTARELTVLRDPQPLPKGLGATAYRTRLTFRVGDHVSPLAVPASVAVAELLP